MESGLVDALRQSAFIGRQHILSDIRATLHTLAHNTIREPHVFYLEGDGGIGKTRLLTEVHQQVTTQNIAYSSNVIDLYHVRYHQPTLLMHTIVQRLQGALHEHDPDTPTFGTYEDAHRRYINQRGHSDSTVQSREELEQAFLEDYRAATEGKRFVLLIDTFEKLRASIPGVATFDRRHSNRMEQWLIHLLDQLPNTFVLIAGRPRAEQHRLLVTTFGERLQHRSVEPFTHADTTEYIKLLFPDVASNPQMQQEIANKLYSVTEGNPILLSIGLSFARINNFDAGALPLSREELRGNNFVESIVNDLRTRHHYIARLIEVLIALRKGLSLNLLRYIVEHNHNISDFDHLRQAFTQLGQLSIAKVTVDPHARPGETVITLHDEVYELLYGVIGGEREARSLFTAAIAYLHQQFEAAQHQIRQGENVTELSQRMQTLQVERLFYQMALDPIKGYQYYRELCYSAIQANDEVFHTQLRDEFARFYEPGTRWAESYQSRLLHGGFRWDRFTLDEGVRAVYRQITEGGDYHRYERALELADRVEQHCQEVLSGDTPEAILDRCSLRVARLQAEIYLYAAEQPQDRDISAIYGEVARQLQAQRAAFEHAGDEATPMQHIDSYHAQLVLATAYSDWGTFERTQLRLGQAIENYKAAIRLFKNLGHEVRELRALTLNDLGNALSLQGYSEEGLRAIRAALRIRESIGTAYPIARTLNTLARVLVRLDQVEAALDYNRAADRLLNEYPNSVRGRALHNLARGFVYRKLAARKHYLPNKEEAYRQAEHAYHRADTAFRNLKEVSRQIEARLGLGKIYREWGIFLRNLGQSEQADEKIQRALEHLNGAYELSALRPGKNHERVDILINQASLYTQQHDFQRARDTLDSAQANVPRTYWLFDLDELDAGTGTLQDIRIYWLRLGQAEMQRGLCDFQQQQYHTGCTRFVRMFAYLMTFFSQPRMALHTYRSLVMDELISLQNETLLRELNAHTQQQVETLLRSLASCSSVPFDLHQEVLQIVRKLFEDAIEEIELF
jgi:tetratricopeptide (TPR) repeat protein